MKPLVIIPSFMRTGLHLEALRDTLASIIATQRESMPDILVVDDCSPDAKLVDALGQMKEGSFEKDLPPFQLIRKRENTGFSSTVNFGLRLAAKEQRDAVLMNSDIEMDVPGWVQKCQAVTDTEGRPAAVVGALLIYPQTGLIQHAGINFSYLTRRFYERFKYGPANLPNALNREVLPVTGAFQYIRAQTLADVGIYDERFKLGYEDVDYCLRVFLAGLECVYEPEVRAWHHESMVRGEKTDKVKAWEAESFGALVEKYRGQSFGQFVPSVL